MKKFVLECLSCGQRYDEVRLRCEAGCDSLLRTCFSERRFRAAPEPGMFKFHSWLPCQEVVPTSAGTVVHPCERLGEVLGLSRLFCAFGGYWPEIGALNMTGTFKDLEAAPTLQSFSERGRTALVVASAGNTARAFANAARRSRLKLFIVIPERMLCRLWLPGEKPASLSVLAVKDSADYNRAIALAERICQTYGLEAEGGARNVARRDGLGTVMLEAVHTLGALPRHYFQAVGSGAGALAVFEAGLRLLGDDKLSGQDLPQLHLSQNLPCTPIADAWESASVIPANAPAEGSSEDLFAAVLANRNPPYAIQGGVREALAACRGRTYRVSNAEALAAARLFEETEGIDLDPAAAVALASLQQAIARRAVPPGDCVLLNATGGGRARLARDFELRPVAADLRLDEEEIGRVGELLR